MDSGKLVLAGLLLFTSSLALQAQDKPRIHYSVESGLVSKIVYDIIQDREGFIWIATEEGVSRFNGIEFENFDKEKGLNLTEILYLFEDSKGRIWLSSLYGEVAYFENDQFYDEGNTPWLGAVVTDRFVRSIVEDKQALFFTYQDGTCYKLKNEQFEKIPPPADKRDKYVSRFIKQQSDTSWLYLTAEGILERGLQSEKLLEQWTRGDVQRGYAFEDKYVLLGSEQIFVVENGKQEVIATKPAFQYVNRFVHHDSFYNDVWIFGRSNNLVRINLSSEATEILFPDKPVSSVMVDNHGNCWVGTLNDGIYKLPSISVFHHALPYGENAQILTCIAQEAKTDKLLVGTDKGVIYFENGSGWGKTTLQTNTKSNEIRRILADSVIYIASDVGLYKVNFGADPELIFSGATKDVCIWRDEVYVAEAHGCFKLGSSKLKGDAERIVDGRTVSLYPTDSVLYIASSKGLYSFNGDKLDSLYNIHDPFDNAILSMEGLSDGSLLFGTQGDGIYLKQQNNFIHFDTRDGRLSSNTCHVIYSEEEDLIWFGTGKGLTRISITDTSFTESQINTLFEANGLPSNFVRDLLIRNDTLWVITDRGLVSLHSDVHLALDQPNLHYRFTEVNGKRTTREQLKQLQHTEKNLYFEFLPLSYQNAGNMIFEYKLSGQVSAAQSSRQPYIRYAELPPGEYLLQAYATAPGGTAISQPVQVTFAIKAAFWQTDTFKYALALLISLLFYLLLYMNNRGKRIRRKRQADVTLLELQTLRAQLNPHFVFNSLNSIQHYIFEQDERSANRYLTKFSTLMRSILASSSKPSVTLREEIELLDLYCQLEKLRFEDRFEYEIEVDSALDTDNIQIPSMLIQPFVENAVNHGLAELKSDGKLEIRFSKVERGVHCVILDNGVGLNEALAKKKTSAPEEGHARPRSTGIIDERIKLINGLLHLTNGEKGIVMKVEDTGSQGVGNGTKVSIDIPLIPL